jgi:hypothetical protein
LLIFGVRKIEIYASDGSGPKRGTLPAKMADFDGSLPNLGRYQHESKFRFIGINETT